MGTPLRNHNVADRPDLVSQEQAIAVSFNLLGHSAVIRRKKQHAASSTFAKTLGDQRLQLRSLCRTGLARSSPGRPGRRCWQSCNRSAPDPNCHMEKRGTMTTRHKQHSTCQHEVQKQLAQNVGLALQSLGRQLKANACVHRRILCMQRGC